jgi:hypothetical protein
MTTEQEILDGFEEWWQDNAGLIVMSFFMGNRKEAVRLAYIAGGLKGAEMAAEHVDAAVEQAIERAKG